VTLLLNFLACGLFGGPKPALAEAWTGLVEGDLERFERVVVLETVAPQATEGCIRVSLLEEWAEQEKKPPSVLRDIGQSVGRGLLTGLVEASEEQLVADARADFGTKRPEELCPAIQPGDPDKARIERDGDVATAMLPIVAYETETFLVADMEKTEEGWKVTGVDFEPAIVELKQALTAPTQ
jgi:hypothetical protein